MIKTCGTLQVLGNLVREVHHAKQLQCYRNLRPMWVDPSDRDELQKRTTLINRSEYADIEWKEGCRPRS
jgi:hypothetical protein